MNALMSVFFPRAEEQDASPYVEQPVIPLRECELAAAFKRLKSRKSPGMDGFTGEMCKCVWNSIPEYMHVLYERCVNDGYFPSEWKCARIVVLLKSPDKIRSNPRSYRGISLLPVLGKVLERVMIERLLEVVEDQMSDRQYGFKSGRCTEDAWHYVRDSVESSTSKYILGVFVDFRGAFDHLSWASVVNKLSECGCREVTLWKSYFSGRNAVVVGRCENVTVDVVRGCPQGSICGPFIWNLMMDSLLRRLEQQYKCCAYADDLLILVDGQSRSAIEAGARECLRIVRDWGDNVGVSLATEKTVTMLLKGRLSASRPPVVRLDGVSLKYVSVVKYLGIAFGERMCFMPHLTGLRARLIGVVAQVRRILRSDWGLSRRAVRTIYGGLFVACAAYGSSVWYEAAATVVGRKKVLACQRVILLGCMAVCRSVSTEALQVLLGAAPLDLEVRRRALMFKIKRGLPLLQNEWLFDRDVGSLAADRVKMLLHECMLSDWQVRWNASENGWVTREFIRDVTFAIDRRDFGFGLSLGYLLTGHGSLNAYLYVRSLSDSPDCRCGLAAETSLHVLCECPLYGDIRALDELGIRQIEGGFDVSQALSTRERVGLLNEFARTLFARRRLCVTEGTNA